MCSSRNYPYLPQQRSFFLQDTPHPWEIPATSFLKILVLQTTPTPSNNPKEIPFPTVGGNINEFWNCSIRATPAVLTHAAALFQRNRIKSKYKRIMSFSYNEIQFKQFCPPMKTSPPPAILKITPPWFEACTTWLGTHSSQTKLCIIYKYCTNLFSSQNLSISQAKWLSISPGLMLVPHIGQHGACVDDDLRLPGVVASGEENCIQQT